MVKNLRSSGLLLSDFWEPMKNKQFYSIVAVKLEILRKEMGRILRMLQLTALQANWFLRVNFELPKADQRQYFGVTITTGKGLSTLNMEIQAARHTPFLLRFVLPDNSQVVTIVSHVSNIFQLQVSEDTEEHVFLRFDNFEFWGESWLKHVPNWPSSLPWTEHCVGQYIMVRLGDTPRAFSNPKKGGKLAHFKNMMHLGTQKIQQLFNMGPPTSAPANTDPTAAARPLGNLPDSAPTRGVRRSARQRDANCSAETPSPEPVAKKVPRSQGQSPAIPDSNDPHQFVVPCQYEVAKRLRQQMLYERHRNNPPTIDNEETTTDEEDLTLTGGDRTIIDFLSIGVQVVPPGRNQRMEHWLAGLLEQGAYYNIIQEQLSLRALEAEVGLLDGDLPLIRVNNPVPYQYESSTTDSSAESSIPMSTSPDEEPLPPPVERRVPPFVIRRTAGNGFIGYPSSSSANSNSGNSNSTAIHSHDASQPMMDSTPPGLSSSDNPSSLEGSVGTIRQGQINYTLDVMEQMRDIHGGARDPRRQERMAAEINSQWRAANEAAGITIPDLNFEGVQIESMQRGLTIANNHHPYHIWVPNLGTFQEYERGNDDFYTRF